MTPNEAINVMANPHMAHLAAVAWANGGSLRDANLVGADLGRADLGGANLWGADLRGANLRRA
ncbi:pentapeptide repeat-containing protein, partial [Phenylobacterium sp.]|uniref:pentapeptide repeat-containing protein n=1 Tax=Phenylobacterium sp. TaxID=1871053 RepID=UPI0025F62C27